MKLYDKVKQLLTDNPELRSNDRALLWEVWNSSWLTKDGYISKENFFKAPSSESITRARRKVQENHKELEANETVKAFRKEKESKKGYHVYHEDVKPFSKHYRFEEGNAVLCSCQIGRNHDV